MSATGQETHARECLVVTLTGEDLSGSLSTSCSLRGELGAMERPTALTISLQRFHQYYGDSLQVECPTGSGDVGYTILCLKRDANSSS